jgi:Tol biopolymer transport system component
LYEKSASGTGAEEIVVGGEGIKIPGAWSSDGQLLSFDILDPAKKARFDIWIYSKRDQRSSAFLHSPFNETHGRLSPDGRSLVYVSDESGRNEVYIRAYPSGEPKLQISTSGGINPRWRRDGKELFYVGGDLKLTAVDTSRLPELGKIAPQPLFPVYPTAVGEPTYDVDAEGKRFLVNTPVFGSESSPITLAINWIPKESR